MYSCREAGTRPPRADMRSAGMWSNRPLYWRATNTEAAVETTEKSSDELRHISTRRLAEPKNEAIRDVANQVGRIEFDGLQRSHRTDSDALTVG